MASSDLEGAEEVLARGLAGAPALSAFFHYQYGRLYSRWNKLSSAIAHLNIAVDEAKARGEEMLALQIVQELRAVRERQLGQRP